MFFATLCILYATNLQVVYPFLQYSLQVATNAYLGKDCELYCEKSQNVFNSIQPKTSLLPKPYGDVNPDLQCQSPWLCKNQTVIQAADSFPAKRF